MSAGSEMASCVSDIASKRELGTQTREHNEELIAAARAQLAELKAGSPAG